MGKTTHVTTSAMPKKPGREGAGSVKLTAASCQYANPAVAGKQQLNTTDKAPKNPYK